MTHKANTLDKLGSGMSYRDAGYKPNVNESTYIK